MNLIVENKTWPVYTIYLLNTRDGREGGTGCYPQSFRVISGEGGGDGLTRTKGVLKKGEARADLLTYYVCGLYEIH